MKSLLPSSLIKAAVWAFVAAQLTQSALAAPAADVDGHKSQSIDQAKGLIKTKEGKQIWRSQMEGKDAHCLSPHPIDGLTQDELSKLVFNKPYDQMLKMKGQDEFQSLGAIVYPGQDGLYVGAGAIEHYQGVQGSGPPYAGVEIVVFKMPAPHKFEVVAHTSQAMAFAGGHAILTDKSTDQDNIEDKLVGFDRATYKIGPDKYALALRISHGDMYSGGGGEAHFLHLFSVENDKISPVFGGLIYDYQLLAGDWNKDQTRQHFTYEDSYALSIGSKSNGGYNDLDLLQTRGGKQGCHYTWNAAAKYYKPTGKVPDIYWAQDHGSK